MLMAEDINFWDPTLCKPTEITSLSNIKVAADDALLTALKAKIAILERRIVILEKTAYHEKVKRNKVVLRELVKEARAKLFDINGLQQPTAKQSSKCSLANLTPQQLQQANVNITLWPAIKKILCPSSTTLNSWVYSYSPWHTAAVIFDMEPRIQSTWSALFMLVHKGQSIERFCTDVELHEENTPR